MSATVKLMLLANKELSDGRCPIALRFTAQRKSKYVTLALRVRPQDWETSRSRVKAKHPESTSINEALASTLAIAEKVVARTDLQSAEVGTIFSAYEKELKQVSVRPESQLTFLEYFKRTVSILYSEKREGTAKNYDEARQYFRSYLHKINRLEILPSEITPSIVIGFQSFLRQHSYSENTVSNRLRGVRATFNRARLEGLVPAEMNAFLGVRLKTQETAKRSLTLEDLKAIKALTFEDKKGAANDRKRERSMEASRNIFLFLVYARGMNLMDAAKLTTRDVQDKRIVYRRSKTSKPISVAITEPVSLLLEYFSKQVNRKPDQGDYLLPIMRYGIKNFRQYYRQQQRRLNERLKEVCQKAGVNKPVTGYWSRHSFATLMKHNGVPVEVISEALGHKDIKTTQIYLASFDKDVVDKASFDTLNQI